MNALTCKQVWSKMTELSAHDSVYNFTAYIDMKNYLVETALFPKATLEAYSAWNLEKEITDTQQQHFNALRGGGQGDYRQGMQAKIENVVSCLTLFPSSKRAIISICNNPTANHQSDDDAKCMREIHFHLENNELHASVFFRAQAALIFPKNIHFIGSLLTEIAAQLPGKPALGNLFYLTSVLVADRK